MEHKRYEKYLIWLVISCIDSFRGDAVSDKMTALHKSAGLFLVSLHTR